MYRCRNKLERYKSGTFVMVFITFKREGMPKVNYWNFKS